MFIHTFKSPEELHRLLTGDKVRVKREQGYFSL